MLALNFTNEGGVGGTTRLLKNICGLWLVQECRRVWSQAGTTYSWEHLTQAAAAAKPLAALINPDDPGFLRACRHAGGDSRFLPRTGQTAPENEGAVIRCALESLALQYRRVLGWLEELIGGRIETIHIVGGGTQNRQLCQMAADACQRRVVAGPVEATAIGNVMMQADRGRRSRLDRPGPPGNSDQLSSGRVSTAKRRRVGGSVSAVFEDRDVVTAPESPGTAVPGLSG